MSAAFQLWLLLMGPVLASFLTALADRFCARGGMLRTRSHCGACGAKIAATDLVPLVSWPLLRGRCRSCGATIPMRLWLAEIAGLLLVAAAIWFAGDAIEAALVAGWLLLLLGLFQTDLLCLRLPDILTFPLLIFGVALGILERGIGPTAIAAAIGPAALWLIGETFRRRRGKVGLGLGDVKMMAGLAAAVGPFALPWLTLIAASSAIGLAVVRHLRGGSVSAGRRIAFGCHLAVAGGLVWLVAAWGGAA